MAHYRLRAALRVAPVVAAIVAASAAVAQQDQPQIPATALKARREIIVTGHGEARARPTRANISVGVVTEDRTSQAAVTANATASQNTQSALARLGVADTDIRTVNYSIEPLTIEGPNRKPAISGYRVTNQVQVTVHDLGKIGTIIDACAAAGSNTIDGISFGLDDPASVSDDVLAKAVADARRKAERIAQIARVRITGVYEVDESGQRPGPVMYGRQAMIGGMGATPIQPGQLTVSEDVTVRYEIGPGG